MKIKQNPGSPNKKQKRSFQTLSSEYQAYLYISTFLPDNYNTYDMNDNPKNNILVSENIRQERLTILEYFSAYHHIMMTNVCTEIFQNC